MSKMKAPKPSHDIKRMKISRSELMSGKNKLSKPDKKESEKD
jgi:hypothetical protein